MSKRTKNQLFYSTFGRRFGQTGILISHLRKALAVSWHCLVTFFCNNHFSVMRYPNTKPYVGKRVAATLIDYCIVFSLTIYYIYAVGSPNDEEGYSVTGWPALVPMLFWFLYFVVAESALGGTLGHLIFNLEIVSVDNKAPTFGQILLRRISDALEIVWCFGLIAFILAKNTDHNQRLGDIWAKTLVTGKDEKFKAEKF